MSKRTQTKPMRGGAKKSSKSRKGKSGKPKKLSSKLKPNEAYCVHPACRKRVVMHNAKDVDKQTKNRKIKMRQGTCEKGHKVFKVVGN